MVKRMMITTKDMVQGAMANIMMGIMMMAEQMAMDNLHRPNPNLICPISMRLLGEETPWICHYSLARLREGQAGYPH